VSLGARLLYWLIVASVFTGLAYWLSGGLADPLLRAFLGLFLALLLAVIFLIDADLARERFRPGPGGVDRGMPVVARTTVFASIVIGLLDRGRYHWSDTAPEMARIAGLAVFAATMLLGVWAVAVNRFWSPVVRIQTERGHHVVTGGPYRFIRHPGYAGILLAVPAGALALGSWWAMLPAAVFCAVVLRRVVIEDAYLHQHLDGYRAYADMVRFRLVPGLW